MMPNGKAGSWNLYFNILYYFIVKNIDTLSHFSLESIYKSSAVVIDSSEKNSATTIKLLPHQKIEISL